jgi:3D (Asp-Asp-Asp) domain-containing protein
VFSTVAAFAMLWAAAFPAVDPISYAAAVAADPVVVESTETRDGSIEAALDLSAEQAEMMARDPDWNAHASLYHAGGGGATGNDSLGCRPVAMRTLATDPRVIPRRTRLFIRETVGIRLPDGTVHDGYWYASDTGGAIRGQRVDLYTGHGRRSMDPVMRFNQRRLTITNAGRFDGCPPAWENASN